MRECMPTVHRRIMLGYYEKGFYLGEKLYLKREDLYER